MQLNNDLKTNLGDQDLTLSQREALEKIKNEIDESKIINLHGARNTGKTYLSWYIAQRTDFIYNPNPESAEMTDKKVIIDHGYTEREETRELRNSFRLKEVECLIYVTRQPASEIHPKIKLEITLDDETIILDNWESLGYSFDKEKSLEDIIKDLRRGK